VQREGGAKKRKTRKEVEMKSDKEVSKMAMAAAANCLHFDFLKKSQERMKFQAVKQGASYEEFKSLVDGATLKPMKSKDRGAFEFVEHRPGHSRFSTATGTASSSSKSGKSGVGGSDNFTPLVEGSEEELASKPASSEVMFLKTWRKLAANSALQRKFLLQHDAKAIKGVFGSPVDASLFAAFSLHLAHYISEGEEEKRGEKAKQAVSLLRALLSNDRWQWTVAFMKEAEKEKVKTLFNAVREAGCEDEVQHFHAYIAIA